jgi:hypothetical protein
VPQGRGRVPPGHRLRTAQQRAGGGDDGRRDALAVVLGTPPMLGSVPIFVSFDSSVSASLVAQIATFELRDDFLPMYLYLTYSAYLPRPSLSAWVQRSL